MTAYYNENNPFAAQWLRNLIAKKLIAPGDVDERSIVDVQPDDLKNYGQCHFFAGIGGWSLAARLAGWDDERPLWTGSCPCQPFSVSGKREGFNDPRHLWPEFKRLMAERQPSVIFGEQSAAAAGWLALVRSDLETMGYAMGAVPMEAASAGAEHFRDRYWFVADYDNSEWRTDDTSGNVSVGEDARWQEETGHTSERRPVFMEHASRFGWGEGWTEHEFRSRGFTASLASFRGKQYFECSDGKWRALPSPRVRWLGNGIPGRVDKLRGLGNAIDPRPAAEMIRAYMFAA
ncbi:Modification methylase HhaI [Agrobacterium sp. DSM 25558]|uniref:DNA cytosine methyltransferase n=1 Tax=Agrobacterium sp. DSM 25558 TaxID=1907665 RepID=UPI000972441F|nr:DNA cytosine methyltransferase [Agrobacterium sp. DSM 25558]SCX26015.1 Modification methylase HhaI [Agrobacterium sp. DSM 25558]